jgi:hypothetical protein
MKPIHKLNGGLGATLCHKCSVIISTGLTEDLYCDTCKPEGLKSIFNLPSVTRVEVIQHSAPHNGRAYTNYNAKDVELQYQDDGKTLKIFLK